VICPPVTNTQGIRAINFPVQIDNHVRPAGRGAIAGQAIWPFVVPMRVLFLSTNPKLAANPFHFAAAHMDLDELGRAKRLAILIQKCGDLFLGSRVE
jgi:hypothetical protein